MNYKVEFKGWGELILVDLFVVYWKVKVDCFFENMFFIVIKFVEYE